MGLTVSVKLSEDRQCTHLLVDAGVRYWEDATVDGIEDKDGSLIPCRDGDSWKPRIALDTGIIENWKKGVEADIHYKVCDDGSYTLLNESGDIVGIRHGYVPKVMCPDDNGFGDYIIMKVDGEGKIQNWKPNVEGFLDD